MRKNISMRFLSLREEWVFGQPRLGYLRRPFWVFSREGSVCVIGPHVPFEKINGKHAGPKTSTEAVKLFTEKKST